ncbi:hypothetical protein Ocin01_03055 [Orchesella cincta]|uniref:DUF4789 domain-containing protein n=1 Tax=Orchesella cincta TaxID=48709 RepID=A0A1D2NEI1_ORCCI|nr:hypothetical protein Ocin01_03055 [Orchesella cincta]
MTMSNRCKWISFGVMSLSVILLLVLLYSLESKNKCPHEGEISLKDTGECYMRETKGPCMNNLVFVEDEPRSHFGACSCPYMGFNRTVLYHDGHCYFVFTQAYCSDGHWLNITTKGEPICEANPCIQHAMNAFEADKNGNDDGDVDMKSNDQYDTQMHDMNGHRKEVQMIGKEFVPIKGGRCAQLGKWTEGCPEGSVVRFHTDYILPSCFQPPKHKLGQSLGAIGVPALNCPVGSWRSIMGKCQPSFDFDFE